MAHRRPNNTVVWKADGPAQKELERMCENGEITITTTASDLKSMEVFRSFSDAVIRKNLNSAKKSYNIDGKIYEIKSNIRIANLNF